MTKFQRLPGQPSELSLVLGVDGSGKSTFLNGLNEHFGVTVLELTITPEAKAFKAAHIETPVDGPFIDQRERIFLELNRQFDQRVNTELRTGHNVAATSNGLVTLVSHGLMRVIVGERNPVEISDAVGRWAESDALKPGRIALVYAPIEVIRERIRKRQQAGDETECFWGFNSPYFLSRYQDAWHEVLGILGRETLIQCVALDSSQLTPDQMISAYGSIQE